MTILRHNDVLAQIVSELLVVVSKVIHTRLRYLSIDHEGDILDEKYSLNWWNQCAGSPRERRNLWYI